MLFRDDGEPTLRVVAPIEPHVARPDRVRENRRRDRVYRIVTRLLAVTLLPAAVVVAPGRARHTACQWALAARFPAEDPTTYATPVGTTTLDNQNSAEPNTHLTPLPSGSKLDL